MDKMREEFEVWAEGRYVLDKNRSGSYMAIHTNNAYDVWQASRAALVVELSKLPEASEYGSGRVYTSHVEDALDNAGIRYD